MPGVILDSKFAVVLQAQAIREGLVSGDPNEGHRATPRELEDCLLSLLLYGAGTYFALEENLFVDPKGFLSLGICSLADPDRHSFPFHIGDRPSESQTLEAIRELKFLRAFVTPFLYRGIRDYLGDDTLLDKAFGISSRKLGPRKLRAVVDALPELAILNAAGLWDTDELERRYPKEAVTIVDLNILDETLVPVLLHFANEPKVLLAESHERQLPVLSTVVRPPRTQLTSFHRSVASELTVLRYALGEEGLELPRVGSLERLMKLSGDERVISFRSVVREFGGALQGGNFGAVAGLQRRVQNATRQLKTLDERRRRLRWSFLLPVATSAVETVLGMLPAASTALTLGLAGVDVALAKAQQRHRWIWLFPERSP